MKPVVHACLLLVTISLLAIFASGCSTAPTPTDLAGADYGRYPDDYEAIIRSHMAGVLKDPYSAQYEFIKGPTRMWSGGNFRSTKFGYGVCAYVNAKNSFGGYTGRRVYYFLIYNDEVVRSFGGGSEIDQASAEKMCGGNW